MKKILVTLLVSAMIVSLAACGNKDVNSSSDVNSSETSSSSEASAESSEESGVPTEEVNEDEVAHYEAESDKVEAAIKEGLASESEDKVKAAQDAVIAALGGKVEENGNYLPSMAIEKDMLTEVYGINMEDVETVIAENAPVSAQVDTFIGIKAKEGKGEAVATALNTYRETLVSDTMQYPMNVAKINASRVYTDGDYVFFTILGSYFENEAENNESSSNEAESSEASSSEAESSQAESSESSSSEAK